MSETLKGILVLVGLVLANVAAIAYAVKNPKCSIVRHHGCENGSCSIPDTLPARNPKE